MAEQKKIIAVVGATGAQGGGLVRAILADTSGGFAVRALTRNPSSDKAKALAAAGAEVVAADLDDQESLEQAFAGAYGAFCLTNFWEHFSVEKEIAQAGNMARAAKAAGVQHVIWSTLEDTRKWVPLSDDRMPTLRRQVQGAALRRQGRGGRRLRARRACPTTFLLTVVLLGQLHLLRRRPAAHAGRQPRARVPHGRQAAPRHRRRGHRQDAPTASSSAGKELIGKTVAIAGEHLTGAAARREDEQGAWARRSSTPTCRPRSTAASASPAPTIWATCSSSSATSTTTSSACATSTFARTLNPELQTFDQWLAEHKGEIPMPE